MAMEKSKPTLVIGDVHGHFDRLEALLLQEGILDEGAIGEEHSDGWYPRTNFDVEIVQLGDLGHFGHSGSRNGDRMCYEAAIDHDYIDLVLWGNHDRFVVDTHHSFGGCEFPDDTTRDALARLFRDGRMVLSAARHGFLLTHAGLHRSFKHNDAEGVDKDDPSSVSDYINNVVNQMSRGEDKDRGIIDAISLYRGGASAAGGILWRDANERLYSGFPQVFGHTKGPKVRYYDYAHSWCVDIGSPDNGRLAGIWLPEERVVEINIGPTSVGGYPLHEGTK
jgi:hypothetical protein